MENKTAIQKVIDLIKNYKLDSVLDVYGHLLKHGLNEEKQQIVDAYEAGEETGKDPHPIEGAYSYYDNTYGKGS